MSAITITIETDNDAFTDPDAGVEVARILSEVAERAILTDGNLIELRDLRLRDINGNTVGMVYVR